MLSCGADMVVFSRLCLVSSRNLKNEFCSDEISFLAFDRVCIIMINVVLGLGVCGILGKLWKKVWSSCRLYKNTTKTSQKLKSFRRTYKLNFIMKLI